MNLELALVLFAIIAFPACYLMWRAFGYQVVGSLLLMGFSGAMIWAFLFGCAYEPVWWIKVTEIVVCITSLLFAIYCLYKEYHRIRDIGQWKCDSCPRTSRTRSTP